MNKYINKAIKERFGNKIETGKLIDVGVVKFDYIPESIHSTDIRLEDNTILRVRHCSPSHPGDLPGIYYCLVSNSRQLAYSESKKLIEEQLAHLIDDEHKTFEYTQQPIPRYKEITNRIIEGKLYDYILTRTGVLVYIKPEV